VEAIRAAIAERTEPKRDAAAELVFVTSRGGPCASGGLANSVGKPFTRLLKAAGLHHEGVGFYTLRHVFRTIADGSRDAVAIDLIMGHTDSSMAGRYRERVEDDRLLAVVNHVRQWLLNATKPDAAP